MLIMRMLLLLLLIPTPLVAAKRLKLSDKEKEWLYMVDPIITYEERREFRKRLQTHHQRAAFMELFWAKRDPDLTDGTNPFKQEYLARYDYVKTHFERPGGFEPTNQKSIIFLLFGQPDKILKRLDFTLVGAGFRNGFPQWPPEVWIYENVGFSYKRKKLKVQFLPTSVFGEYGRTSDAYTTNFIRMFRHKLIQHPDLERAPLTSVSATNFQEVVDLAPPVEEDDFADLEEEPEKKGFFSRFRRSSKKEKPVDAPAVVSIPRKKVVTAPPPEAPEKAEESDAPASRTAVKPKTEASKKPAAKPDARVPKKPAAKTAPRVDQLAVPSTTAVPAGSKPLIDFKPDVGNPKAVEARLSYFTSGKNDQLLLGRFGFPLKVLSFDYQNSQYEAPFILHFSLTNAAGEIALMDSIRNEIRLPSKAVLTKRNPYYAKEFAIILPPDRYTLKVQLEDTAKGQFSYQETTLELPKVDTPVFRTSALTLMDANVNPDSAKFRIEGTAYGLHLSRSFKQGERLYPLIELIEPPDESIWENASFQLLQNETLIRDMILFEEEAAFTGQGSILIHPVIKTDRLAPGAYQLRFEVEDPSGELMISELEFEVVAP